ncbi:MAG: hypothetical protein JOZ18_07285 [Chloroflexi bacterium]|nr:hypothetical protein [Chloroflexota bacterium]
MTEYANFRQQLDAILRTLDVKQVQDFLVAEGQWDTAQPADPELAMWMMVAGSPTLLDLHERAYNWLVSHGHEDDARAVLSRSKKQSAATGRANQRSRAPKGEKHSHQRSGTPAKKQGPAKRERHG